MFQRVRAWIPAAVWMAVIFLFSTDLFAASNTGSWVREMVSRWFPSLSEAWVSGLHHALRKSAHVFAYGVLSACYSFALSGGERLCRPNRRRAVAAVGLSILYACTDEWHQSFVPGRTPDLRDIVADGSGAALALGAAWAWSIIKRPS